MVWSTIGKILLRAIPVALSVAENAGAGQSKGEVYHKAVTDSINEFRPDIAKHPKVAIALQKVADANVELQNVVASLISDEPGDATPATSDSDSIGNK